jgi:hypothetical protein
VKGEFHLGATLDVVNKRKYFLSKIKS